MIITEAFGRALVIEPYFATVVLGGGALRHAGNEALLKELVPAIVEGKLTLALAHHERQARYDLADIGDRGAHRRQGRLHAGRREERRAARRQRGQAHRGGARLRRPHGPQAASASSWSTPRPTA